MINTGAAGPVLHARSAQAFNAVQQSARGRFTSQIHSSNKVHLRLTQVSLSKMLRTQNLNCLQVIHWMRHGQTEMNVHLGTHFTPTEGYEDPLL